MRSDLAVLACTNKLASLSASTAAPVQSEDECSLSCFFCGLQEVRELDLSCCDHWESRDGVDGVSELFNGVHSQSALECSLLTESSLQ